MRSFIYNMKHKEAVETLKSLLLAVIGRKADVVTLLPQAGSDRSYYRLSVGKNKFIGTYVPDPVEGECFVRLSDAFSASCGLVPRVFAATSDFRFYIQEDLGDVSLFSALDSPEVVAHIKETLSRLVVLQKTPGQVWIRSCMARPFSRRQVMWDLNYFKYEFLKPQEVIFDEECLEDDFDRLADRLLGIPEEFMGFMMRDCQSRNVMLTSRGPVFIDFQGGRRGPALYDAVSLLWQAKAGFDPSFREEMLDFYCEEFCSSDQSMKEKMLASLDDLVIFRTLQVLGAYGFRGLVQHRAHFIQSIPGAIANLRELYDKGALDGYPELRKCAAALIDGICHSGPAAGRLRVEVYSFSYKKGYPRDHTGNGGGFMFDCRALHNPGRYPEYRSLTGRDRAVVEFLEERGEVQPFLSSAWSLTDPAVERYLSRRFTCLQIGFGCTGGQHRSVYCAERTAEHLKELFPEADVRLIHREHPE